MSIIDCPPELLHLIGSYLHQKDTCNLISTSHRMHSVFQRKLYTNVTLGVKNANSAQSFLYTVARNPELAGYVQSLALAGWETYQDWETNRGPEKPFGRPKLDSDLIRKLVDEASDYHEEEKSKWLQDLKEFYDDAWLALLIPRLTGLRKIGLKWPFCSPHVSIMLNKAAINGGACFPRLEEVNICWYDSKNAIASYQMHPFFKFPSVRKVSGWKVVENAKQEEVFEPDPSEIPGPTEILKDVSLPPRCSNVTDIDLSGTNAAEGMREWIRACKTLKSLRIIHDGACITSGDFQPRKLYNSLSRHKSTLEAIWVEHDEYGLDGDNDNDWMGSFVDFSAMKFLRLSLYNLVGLKEQGSPTRKISDVIPSSLETLFLDIHWVDFCDILDDLAEIATSRRFSKIAIFHIQTCIEWSSPEEDVKVEWLQQRCREVGLACHVHDTWDREYMEGLTNQGIHSHRIEYTAVEYDEDSHPDPKPEQRPDENENHFLGRMELWEVVMPIKRPEPAEFKSKPDEKIQIYDIFGKTGLQVIVKLANIELSPESPEYEGRSWHIEGQLNEGICATAIYYYDSENITEKDIFDSLHYPQIDHRFLQDIYGLDPDMLSRVSGNQRVTQHLGGVVCRQGRLLTLPNVVQHRVTPFSSADKSKPGHRKIFAFFLVDPHLRVISTANVPPQQEDWDKEKYDLTQGMLSQKVPPELRNLICDEGILQQLISMDEAKKFRLELMEERSVNSEKQNETFENSSFNLCEH